MPDIPKMTDEELRALVVKLFERIAELERENEVLKAALNKNSRNSSKPPSQDGFKRPPNLRKKTGNKPGGVEGHKGHRFELPEDYRELINNGVAQYELIDHTNGEDDYVSKWVIDVRVTPVFIEHRFLRGEVPVKYNNEVTYGEEIKALSIHLTDDGMISAERLADFFSSVTNGIVHPSKAALYGFQNELSDILDPEISAITEDIQNSPVINIDDSPMRSTQTVVYIDGKEDVCKEAHGGTFSVTTRTYSTDHSTVYTVNPQKNLDGVYRDGIVNDYDGTLVHDHDVKLYNFGGRHGECNVHPARELRGLCELGIGVAGEIRDLLLHMNDHKNNDLIQSRDFCEPVVLEQFERQYVELLRKGDLACDALDKESCRYKKFNALLARLYAYSDEHLLFIRDYSVPFSNNLAERDLRAEKTKEKVSGCFRSWRGIEGFMKIRSFISTVRKRGLNVVDSLRSVFKGESVLVQL